MSEQTTRDRAVSGMNRIAMHAIAQHMLDHQLPAPITIEAPHTCGLDGEQVAVTVSVPSAGADEWTDTVDVQLVTTRPVGEGRGLKGWEATEHRGRIETPVGLLPVVVKVIRKVDESASPELRLVGTEVPC